MVDEVARRRYQKAKTTTDCSVEDALNACLADNKDRKYSSIFIIAIPEDEDGLGDSCTYVAGPGFATFYQAYMRLQSELFWMMQWEAEGN